MVGTLNQLDSCTEVHGGAQRCAWRCMEVQDFMIIRLVNANDLIDHGGNT